MKINSTNQFSFKAGIDTELKGNVVNYFNKRGLPTQLQEFEKTMSKIGDYGSETSVFFSKRIYKTGEQRSRSYLFFQNNKINLKELLVNFEITNFSQVIEFLNQLTEEKIKGYEAKLTDKTVPVFKI